MLHSDSTCSDETPDWEAAWQEFRRGPLTLPEDPSIRESWHQGRSRYAVWVLRVDDAAVRERVTQVASCLRDAIVPEPVNQLHITLFVAGFITPLPTRDDDVDELVLRDQVEDLSRAMSPLVLEVGAAHSFLSVPTLRVHDPRGDLARLRRVLSRRTREIRFAAYYPHITVGRYRDARSTREISSRIEALWPWPPLPIVVDAIDLVCFDGLKVDTPLESIARIDGARDQATRAVLQAGSIRKD